MPFLKQSCISFAIPKLHEAKQFSKILSKSLDPSMYPKDESIGDRATRQDASAQRFYWEIHVLWLSSCVSLVIVMLCKKCVSQASKIVPYLREGVAGYFLEKFNSMLGQCKFIFVSQCMAIVLVALVLEMVRNMVQYLLTMECIGCSLFWVISFSNGRIPRFLIILSMDIVVDFGNYTNSFLRSLVMLFLLVWDVMLEMLLQYNRCGLLGKRMAF